MILVSSWITDELTKFVQQCIRSSLRFGQSQQTKPELCTAYRSRKVDDCRILERYY